ELDLPSAVVMQSYRKCLFRRGARTAYCDGQPVGGVGDELKAGALQELHDLLVGLRRWAEALAQIRLGEELTVRRRGRIVDALQVARETYRVITPQSHGESQQIA